MSDAPLWLFGLLGGLLLVSGVFSASETALFSLSEPQRGRAGPAARRLLDQPRSLLVVVLVCNLVVNVLFFAFVTRLHPPDAEGGSPLVDFGALVALLLAGEILPKSIALRARVSVARFLAPILAVAFALLAPVRAALIGVLDGFSALIDKAVPDEAELTQEDLASVLERSAEEGELDSVEADLLGEIVELADIRVREIMTPRVDARFLDLAGGEREAVARASVLAKEGWLPVVDGNPDRVVGRVRVRDLLHRPDRTVAQLVMPVKFVPEVASALDLLRTLQEDRVAEAVVLDEWGGTAGVVTIEDVFEELVGELRAEGESRAIEAVPLGEGRYRVPGWLPIRDWNERFGFRVVPTEFETVGGFVTALLGRIPRTGDVARYGSLVLAVHEARGRRVLSIDIGLAPPGAAPHERRGEWRADREGEGPKMTALVVLGLLVASGVFSGAETGFYSLSRVRLRAEAKQGRWIARLIEALARNPTAFLITLLVGNNLALELMTHVVDDEVSGWAFLPSWAVELTVTLLLTPVVFFGGELFPKDLFRRRPRRLYGAITPVLLVARVAFAPIAIPLAWASSGLERLFGVRSRELERELGHERVQEVLNEGARSGVLPPRAQELAGNVAAFRTRRVTAVMVPWGSVESVDAGLDAGAARERMAGSPFSRLPLVEAIDGKPAVRAYLHQLDVLAEAIERGDATPRPPAELARPLPVIAPDATVDRALARLRAAGQRMALVGTPEAPLGIVTLKDLVQTISGELGGW